MISKPRVAPYSPKISMSSYCRLLNLTLEHQIPFYQTHKQRRDYFDRPECCVLLKTIYCITFDRHALKGGALVSIGKHAPTLYYESHQENCEVNGFCQYRGD